MQFLPRQDPVVRSTASLHLLLYGGMPGRRRDARSVSGYKETLEVLGRLQGRDADPARPAPPVSPRGPAEAPGVEEPPRRPVRPLAALDRGSRRPRPPLGVGAAVLLAAAGIAYGVVSVLPHHRSPAPAGHSERSSTTTTSTTTTLPATYSPTSAAASSATYAPVTASYTLTVGATSAACWVSVTLSDGTTVLAKTFAPGTSTSVPVTGRASIDLGAPTVASLAIGGVPVTLPTSIVGPFTVTLVPR